MGGGSSKQKQSVKVDQLQSNIDDRKLEENEEKKQLRESVKQKSKNRSKSENRPELRLDQDEQSDQQQNADGSSNVERWNHNSPAVKASRRSQIEGLNLNDHQPQMNLQGQFGGLDETVGQRRHQRRNQNGRRDQSPNQGQNLDSEPALAHDPYEDLLNEAIIQSLMDHTAHHSSGANLELPSENEEEKILQEVMKMSALEYQKNSGKIDLSHLKRKQKPAPQKKSLKRVNDAQDDLDLDDSLNDAQLAKLARMAAPSNLAPIHGSKKVFSNLPSLNHNISLKTTDISSTIQVQQSQVALTNMQNQIDEDSIMKEFQSESISPRTKHTKLDYLNKINSGGDLETMDPNSSPMKLDMQLEKMMNEQNGKNQKDDLDFLMMNIEKENRLNQQSPETVKHKSKKKININRRDANDGNEEFITLDDIARQSNAKTTNFNQSSIRSPTELGYEDSNKISASNLGFQFDYDGLKPSNSRKNNIFQPQDYDKQSADVDQLAEELMINISPEKTMREYTEETPLMKMEQQVDHDPIKVQNNSPRQLMQVDDNDLLSQDLGSNLDNQVQADIATMKKLESNGKKNESMDVLDDLDNLF